MRIDRLILADNNRLLSMLACTYFRKLSAVSLLHGSAGNCLPAQISRYYRRPANFHICDVDHRDRVRQEERISDVSVADV